METNSSMTGSVPIRDEENENQEGPNRGDEGIIEGVAIGDRNSDDTSNDSDSSEDDGVVIHVSGGVNVPVQRRRLYEKGANTYIRPELIKDINKSGTEQISKKSAWDDLKPLQYNYHRTAFDINIDELDDHPWRQPNVDISDYFNYGFTEATWMKYCENQLRLRIAEDLGPNASNNAAAAVITTITGAGTVPTATFETKSDTAPRPVPLMMPPPIRPPFPPPELGSAKSRTDTDSYNMGSAQMKFAYDDRNTDSYPDSVSKRSKLG